MVPAFFAANKRMGTNTLEWPCTKGRLKFTSFFLMNKYFGCEQRKEKIIKTIYYYVPFLLKPLLLFRLQI